MSIFNNPSNSDIQDELLDVQQTNIALANSYNKLSDLLNNTILDINRITRVEAQKIITAMFDDFHTKYYIGTKHHYNYDPFVDMIRETVNSLMNDKIRSLAEDPEFLKAVVAGINEFQVQTGTKNAKSR